MWKSRKRKLAEKVALSLELGEPVNFCCDCKFVARKKWCWVQVTDRTSSKVDFVSGCVNKRLTTWNFMDRDVVDCTKIRGASATCPRFQERKFTPLEKLTILWRSF